MTNTAMSWMLSFVLRAAFAFVLLTAFRVVSLSFPEWSFSIGVLAGIFLPVVEILFGKDKQP